MVPVTLAIQDDALLPVVVEDVVVRVYNEAGTVFVTDGVTNVDGELTLDLADLMTYWVRFFKVGYGFDSRLLIFVDSGATTNTFDAVARDLTTYPASVHPGLCRITGVVVAANGAASRSHVLRFALQRLPQILSGRPVVSAKVVVVSDNTGRVSVELIRGALYDAIIDGLEEQPAEFKVPDYGSADVSDALWPYALSLTFDPATITLAVGEVVEVPFTLTLSNRYTLPYLLSDDKSVRSSDFVDFAIANEAIAVVAINHETATATVTGVSAGTTNLSATAREGIPRLPVPTYLFDALTITVN